MSIAIENPQTLLEKIDALTNLVEQMYLAHKVHDNATFERAHSSAAELGFDITQTIAEQEEE